MASEYNPVNIYDTESRQVQDIKLVSGKIKTSDGTFLVTYYTDNVSWGTEIYKGKNYVVGSTDKSWSRNYRRWVHLPDKWVSVASRLRSIHRKRFG
jgi:hypothetical protein